MKKQSGDDYPAETLYEIIISIQLYFSKYSREMKLLSHDEFTPLKNCLDNRMKELSSQGMRTEKKQAEPITVDEENLTWENGILATTFPEKKFWIHSNI